MKNVLTSASLLALGAVGVQTAQAQFVAGAEKPWSLAGTVRGFYDDNYNTQPDGPGRVSSFGFELRPSAALNLVKETTTLNASYTYSMKYYDDRRTEKADHSHDFELFANHNFSERYTADVTESFVIAQEPEVLDRTLSLPLRSNGNNLRNHGAINFHAQITRLLGIVIGYANTLYDYQDNRTPDAANPNPNFSTLLNRMEHLVTLDTRWQVWEETTGLIGYQFGAVDYSNSGSIAPFGSPPVPATARNNYSHYFYVGAEHFFRRDLSASVRVGAQYVDYYNDPTSSSSVSPYVDASVNYTYMDGGTLVAGFRNSRNQTDVAAVTAGNITQDQESSTVYGSIVQKLTPLSPNLTASITGQYQNSTFHGGGVNNLTDDFYLVGLNLAYQFNRYLSGEIGYNYDKLASDLIGRGYDRNRVYVGVTASY